MVDCISVFVSVFNQCFSHRRDWFLCALGSLQGRPSLLPPNSKRKNASREAEEGGLEWGCEKCFDEFGQTQLQT